MARLHTSRHLKAEKGKRAGVEGRAWVKGKDLTAGRVG